MIYNSRSDKVYQVFIHIVVGIVAISALFPLIYVMGMSLTSLSEMIKRNFFVIIPDKPTIEAYKRILQSVVIWRGLGISVFRSLTGTFLTLTFTFMGAFVLSRKGLPGRKYMLFFVLATILFNGGLIPTYLVMTKLHLQDNLWVLIIPSLVDSYGLLVIKVFIENLSSEIMEATQIDGASEFQLMTRIVLPLTAPSLAAIGLFNAVGHWNNWFDALIYIQNKSFYPFQLILQNMLTSSTLSTDTMNNAVLNPSSVSNETMKMAAVIVGIIPILCVYPFLQKHFDKGMYLGAVKG